nr:PREDICTED: relA-associated inhibitor isoform X2 [Latimeria chalumnae]|eukprot:XP_014341383.1 PREDICTED: relA-associated inhibitor isoform X2 [Latimeria chalumnae]
MPVTEVLVSSFLGGEPVLKNLLKVNTSKKALLILHRPSLYSGICNNPLIIKQLLAFNVTKTTEERGLGAFGAMSDYSSSHASVSGMDRLFMEKQLELDAAVAKVDELSSMLQNIWSDQPTDSTDSHGGGQGTKNFGADLRSYESFEPVEKMTPTMSTCHSSSNKPSFLEGKDDFSVTHRSGGSPPLSVPTISFKPPSSQSHYSPDDQKSPYSTLDRRSPSLPKSPLYDQLSPISQTVRSPSIRSPTSSPLSLRSSPRPTLTPQFDYRPSSPQQRGSSSDGRVSPVVTTDQLFSPRRLLVQPYDQPNCAPSPRPGSGPGGFTQNRTKDDMVIGRKPPSNWNESDLDVPYESTPRMPSGLWRESNLDGSILSDKQSGSHSSTFPRSYQFSPAPSDRRLDRGFWKPGQNVNNSTLPVNWKHSQQAVSRIPIPPSTPQGMPPRQRRPLPISMILRLQHAHSMRYKAPIPWGSGLGQGGNSVMMKQQQQPQPQAPAVRKPYPVGGPPQLPAGLRLPADFADIEPELENILPSGDAGDIESVPRPLSPTRLQPLLVAAAGEDPEMEEILRMRAEIPRALKRRTSGDQTVTIANLPPHNKQYKQIINRLFRKGAMKKAGDFGGDMTPILEQQNRPKLVPLKEAVGERIAIPTLITAPVIQERKSTLKKSGTLKKGSKLRARLSPLVLLLDAALVGELDVVQKVAQEMSDPSKPNDEGITALHNAICGENNNIVLFLINIGANVNAPDSHGWTPLHCAASCNDTHVCNMLVKHGAAIFATTYGYSGATAAELCDPYTDGYDECAQYMYEMEQGMGLMNNGVVYALWSYSAEFQDELSFHEGDAVTILRRGDKDETEWWWASLYGKEGYVPRNYFGLFPRVRPQKNQV